MVQVFSPCSNLVNVPEEQKQLLKESCQFAQLAHGDQMRQTGLPYFVHPFEVAQDLWLRFRDVELTCAGLLHDVLEDCEHISRKDMYTRFGAHIGFLVDAVTKSHHDFYQKKEKAFDKIEKVLWGGMHDFRVFLLKLADREHNLQSLEALKNGKQIRIAFETQAIYQPLSDMIQFDNKALTVADMEALFWSQVPKSWKEKPEKLKHFLLDQSLENMDGSLFDSIYADSGSPLWSINDWETYERITSDDDICKNIHFVSVKGNNDTFIAHFQFTGGALLKGVKFDISGYRGKGQ